MGLAPTRRSFALLHGFLSSTPQQSVLAAIASNNLNRRCNDYEGGKLSPRELQGKYMAALSRIGDAHRSGTAKRHTPIFKRGPAIAEKQAIQDAAIALAALWKIGEPIKR
jgi:hypothetical protein